MSGLLHDAIADLWHGGGPALSNEALARLANLTAEASARADTLATTLDALACLIAEDDNDVFDRRNTVGLLTTLSQAADGIATMIAIGDLADITIRMRRAPD